MNHKLITFFSASLILLVYVVAAFAAEPDDHPLISRYAGSVIKDKKVAAFTEYKLVTGLTSQGDLIGEKIQGKVTRIVDQNPQGRSTLEIFKNDRQALAAAGAALAQGIDRDGKISVYGIYFDTDKADVKAESKPALDEIAKLLKSRPELKLLVVGHTDISGALAHIRTLSEARARAVAKVMVSDYQIGEVRLEGYGVGPLAPTAPNASADGRVKNRRVELVAR